MTVTFEYMQLRLQRYTLVWKEQRLF